MSDQDFVIVDEEKDSEIPQEKENRTEDSRKEVVKDLSLIHISEPTRPY